MDDFNGGISERKRRRFQSSVSISSSGSRVMHMDESMVHQATVERMGASMSTPPRQVPQQICCLRLSGPVTTCFLKRHWEDETLANRPYRLLLAPANRCMRRCSGVTLYARKERSLNVSVAVKSKQERKQKWYPSRNYYIPFDRNNTECHVYSWRSVISTFCRRGGIVLARRDTYQLQSRPALMEWTIALRHERIQVLARSTRAVG